MRACWALLFVLAVAAKKQIKEEGTPAPPSEQATVKERTRLLKDLLRHYDKNINPDKPNLKFGVALLDVKLNAETSTLETNAWLRYVWKDNRLTWNEAEYGGLSVLRVPSNLLWKPDVVLYNAVDLAHTNDACWDSNILIYPTGEILWVPPCHFSSSCVNTLQERPYEPQTCILKFGSWTFDSEAMDINFYNNQTEIDLSDFWNLPPWKLLNTTAVRNSKLYTCCSEAYVDLTFSLTLRRQPAPPRLCSSE